MYRNDFLDNNDCGDQAMQQRNYLLALEKEPDLNRQRHLLHLYNIFPILYDSSIIDIFQQIYKTEKFDQLKTSTIISKLSSIDLINQYICTDELEIINNFKAQLDPYFDRVCNIKPEKVYAFLKIQYSISNSAISGNRTSSTGIQQIVDQVTVSLNTTDKSVVKINLNNNPDIKRYADEELIQSIVNANESNSSTFEYRPTPINIRLTTPIIQETVNNMIQLENSINEYRITNNIDPINYLKTDFFDQK